MHRCASSILIGVSQCELKNCECISHRSTSGIDQNRSIIRHASAHSQRSTLPAVIAQPLSHRTSLCYIVLASS